ncbi:MAG: hypothetical protein ACRERR_02615 [Moraxellaceae bacterium]
MKRQAFFALAVLLTAVSSYAIEADILVGRQWAKCSQQAKILRRLSKDPVEAKTLKRAGAFYRIYADAALGSSASLTERENTEALFLRGIAVGDKVKTAAHVANFYRQAKADAKACSASFAQHGSRFDSEVHQLLKRSGVRSSSTE